MHRQGLRLSAWVLLAVGLLAVAGRLEARSVGPFVVEAPEVPATRRAWPPATVAVRVSHEPAGLPGTPVRVAFGDGVLWAAGPRALYRVVADEGYQAATSVRPGAGGVLDVAAGAGAVWLAVADPGSVWRLDGTGRLVARVPLGLRLTGTVRIAVPTGDPAGDVWVACCGRDSGTVLRIDPATNRVAGRVAVPNGPTALAAGSRHAMVTTQLNELVEISAATTAAQVLVRNNPGSLMRDVALTADAAWLAVPGGRIVLRRAHADGRLRAFRLPGGVRALAAGRSGVWALSRDGLAVTPIDRAALGPVRRIAATGGPTRQVVVGDAALWLVPEDGPSVVRLTFPEDPGLATM